ncbi:hypothetical protein GXW83_27515 [Streptacidiphilus sp. PB12-B1b]|uniref:hypothetical protein n=1 Tax=Streptacidiphilus sp. PB12-B1b TaxID=2705012 RepID=UPI0015FCBD7B|nr:hypothetical protein [Streptacidiphilus sp. PB12-B1b]QMU78894.1 hypothetical protein GXW83_27515 [Streptacidiphilus sp. PB12-B1b]
MTINQNDDAEPTFPPGYREAVEGSPFFWDDDDPDDLGEYPEYLLLADQQQGRPSPEQPRMETAAPAGPKTRVIVNNQALAAEWLRGELGQDELSCLFRRDWSIVHTPRIGEDGYRPPSEEDQRKGVDHGPAQVRPVTAAHVCALIDVRYEVVRERENKRTGKKTHSPALFPPPAANSAVNAASIGEGTPNLRELLGVTHTPILRPDGTVLETPGYDDATGLLYLPTGDLRVPQIPFEPTREEIETAVRLILEPVADFPFVSERHRTNWVGAMMTPILRTILPPPYPWFVITAPQPGSGKTLLAKAMGIVHGMAVRPELPAEDEELRKVITTTLLDTTAPVVLFDNLAGVVRSSVLEALLTSASYNDRLLGAHKGLSLVNDRLWVGTGNNAKIGGDLARRTYDVVINPKCPDPFLRTGFTIVNLEAWMEARRGDYLGALLTVARGWVVDGKPSKEKRSDSYARWDGSLRMLLANAGLGQDFGQARESDLGAVSEDDADWGAFLAEVHRVFGDQAFRSKDVLDRIGSDDLAGFDSSVKRVQPEKLPGDLADKWSRPGQTAGVAKSLGRWLSNREGRYADGYTVVLQRQAKDAKWYRVELAEKR